MRKSENISELSTALAKAQATIKHAEKTSSNPFYKSSYADLSAIIDAAKPALAANGLSVIQSPHKDEGGNWVMETLLLHSSGQWIEGEYPINPVKNDPQGYGSAVTYARRYHYGAMCGVSSVDEDDDGNAASGTNGKNGRQTEHNKPNPPASTRNVEDNRADPKDVAELRRLVEVAKVKQETVARWLDQAGVKTLDELSADQVAKATAWVFGYAKKRQADEAKQPAETAHSEYVKWVEQLESIAQEVGTSPATLSSGLAKYMKAQKLAGKEHESTPQQRAQVEDLIRENRGYFADPSRKETVAA